MDKLFDDRLGWEAQNMLTVARLNTASAPAREESRGVHFRTVLPQPEPKQDPQHLIVQRRPGGLEVRPEGGTAKRDPKGAAQR